MNTNLISLCYLSLKRIMKLFKFTYNCIFLFSYKVPEDGVPSDISFQSQVFDLSFHPNRDIIAAGEIEGRVTV